MSRGQPRSPARLRACLPEPGCRDEDERRRHNGSFGRGDTPSLHAPVRRRSSPAGRHAFPASTTGRRRASRVPGRIPKAGCTLGLGRSSMACSARGRGVDCLDGCGCVCSSRAACGYAGMAESRSWTKHTEAPHAPRSQSFFVPVRWSASRSASSNVTRLSSTDRNADLVPRRCPFTLALVVIGDLPVPGLRRRKRLEIPGEGCDPRRPPGGARVVR
jgi:hypothetical protein